MPVKFVIEVVGPITEEDKLVLSNATVALLSIANVAMGVQQEEEADPPPPPPAMKPSPTKKEVN